MRTHLSTWHSATLAWLAASALALAQPNSGPPSMTSLYGTNPASPPDALGAQRSGPTPVVPLSTGGNATTGSSSNAVGAITAQGSGTSPGGSVTPNPGVGAGSTVPAIPGSPVQNLPAAPDLSQTSITMPNSMDMIDNQHKLAPNDMFNFQILEDRDPPVILLVNESGSVDIPYLGMRNVKDLTLQQMAKEIKKELEDPSSYYKQATVLAAPYKGERSRGQIIIMGQVQKPGSIEVPVGKVLTLWGVLEQAGGFTLLADETQVTLIHHDASDPTNPNKETRQTIDVAKILSEGNVPDNLLTPGDFITVPSRTVTSGNFYVAGEVNKPGMYSLSSDVPITITQGINMAGGFTDWSKETTVQVTRFDKDGKPLLDKYGKPVPAITVDVEAILKKGDAQNDIKLQPFDRIWVDKSLFKFN